MLARLYGLQPNWLNACPGYNDSWTVLFKLFAGAVPAGTLRAVMLPNFNKYAFVERYGATRGAPLAWDVDARELERILDGVDGGRALVVHTLATPHTERALAACAGLDAVRTLYLACEHVARRVQLRATVGASVALDAPTIPLDVRAALRAQAGAHHADRVAFPIRLLAIEAIDPW